MTNERELIEKLYSIARNQQKIITKLAQQAQPQGGASGSWADVSADVLAKLKTIPEAKGYSVYSAEVASSDGSLKGKILYPKGDLNASKVMQALKNLVAGETLRTKDGATVDVTLNPEGISFIAMT